MNILFIVMVAIFYVVGSALKAKANKARKQDKEQLTRKPTRLPPAGRGGVQRQVLERPRRAAGPAPTRQYQQQVQPARRKVARPQPAAQKFAAKEEQAVVIPALEPLEVESVELVSKPLEKLTGKQVPVPAETPQAKYLSEILLDYADPDELKTAILHYEILGKPLSLRAPSERIIGL
jgi:hypothetical protein